jgi:hypothetical protein
MVPRAPPAIASPPVLRSDWETLARLASTWSKLLNLDACPTPSHPPVGFVAQPTNRILLDFEAQTKKPSRWFWGPNYQTVAPSFEAKLGNPPPPWFWGSTKKPLPPVLMLNWRKQSQWFWDQTTNKSSTLVLRLNQEIRAPRLHVHGADRTQCHPTSQSPGHQVSDPWDHPRSSVSALLLLSRSSSLYVMSYLPPAHHETSKHDSSNETKIKVKQMNHPEFEFKPHQVNDWSQSN